MKQLLKLIAAGGLVVMGICIFSAWCAIGSIDSTAVTLEYGTRWLVISWWLFIAAMCISLVTGLAADKLP